MIFSSVFVPRLLTTWETIMLKYEPEKFEEQMLLLIIKGEQFIVEIKIWHDEEYNHCGEQQLVGYLED